MHCAVLAFVPRVLFSLIVFLINLIVLLQSNSLFLVMNSEVCVWYIAIWFVTSEKKNCFVLLSSGSAAVFEPISGSGSAAAFVNQAAVAAAPLL